MMTFEEAEKIAIAFLAEHQNSTEAEMEKYLKAVYSKAQYRSYIEEWRQSKRP